MPDTHQPTQTRSVSELRGPAPQQQQSVSRRQPPQQVAPEAQMPAIRIGFGDLASFEFSQRVAKGLASSTLVPPQYRLRVQNKKTQQWEDNPSAIPNCIIALNMADRIGADPLMVMQNLYIVEGRPAWSAQFVIAAINSCRRYTSLQYEVTRGEAKSVSWTETVWDDGPNGRRVPSKVPKTAVVPMITWVAWAIEKETGARIESPPVTMEMAVAEGWYGKPGSKWQTMPEIMGRYRSASFFGRTYCPELLMGIRTVEEEVEILDAQRGADNTWSVPPEEFQPQNETTAAAAAASGGDDGGHPQDGDADQGEQQRGQTEEVVDQETGEVTRVASQAATTKPEQKAEKADKKPATAKPKPAVAPDPEPTREAPPPADENDFFGNVE